MAKIVERDVKVTLADGTFYKGCIKTLEWNSLEQDSGKHKYFAPGVGLIKEESFNREESMEIKGTFYAGDAALSDFYSAVFINPTVIDNNFLPLPAGVAMN
jgi:hypothetical protein